MEPESTIVGSGTILRQLGKQLSAQRTLHQQLKQLLPAPLDSQLKAAVLQHGNLNLFVASPVWASRFRYLLPQLRANGIDVKQVRTRILPNDSVKPRQKKRDRIVLSQEAGEQLRQSAEAIEDPSLREALLRISRHGMVNR
ncbi:MAG: DciA family protein [Candidatus Thiodiazotropha endolucinida]